MKLELPGFDNHHPMLLGIRRLLAFVKQGGGVDSIEIVVSKGAEGKLFEGDWIKHLVEEPSDCCRACNGQGKVFSRRWEQTGTCVKCHGTGRTEPREGNNKGETDV